MNPQPARPTRRFTDRLPPFLLKEIRQSLRSRRFVRNFIGLQLLLIAFTFTAVAGALGLAPADVAEGLHYIFWFIVAIPLVAIPPLSNMIGMARIQSERSLELVFMTSMSVGRAVTGMWLAQLCEALLLTLAALPYLILRYYLGGVDLIQELAIFLLLIISSAVITAMSLGLSTYRHWLARVVILCLSGGLVFMFCGLLIFVLSEWEFEMDTFKNWRWAVFALGILPTWTWMFLQLGASHLAAPAENYATKLRLGHLALLGMVAACQYEVDLILLFLFLIISVPLLTEVMSEPFRGIPPLFTPARHLPGLKRMVGRILYPGWPAGAWFVAIFCLVLAGICIARLEILPGVSRYSSELENYKSTLTMLPGIAFTILGSSALYRLRWPWRDPSQVFFAMVFIIQLGFLLIVAVITEALHLREPPLVLALMPAAGSFATLIDSNEALKAINYIVYPIGSVISLVILTLLAWPHWRTTAALEQGHPAPAEALRLPPAMVD